MSEILRIGVAGAHGRMARALIREILANVDQQLSLSAVIASDRGNTSPGDTASSVADTANIGRSVLTTLEAAEFDVLIDFTTVESTLKNLQFCMAQQKRIVIGTTGFSAEQQRQIAAAGKLIPIVQAPNMSVGVNLCFHLLRQAAATIGNEADIEIMETHHRHKLDAPSGTALRMGEIIATALGRELEACAVYDRAGLVEPRSPGSIGFSSIRAGDVVGDHTVLFATQGERLEITHKSSNRQTFANGAVRAARWLSDKTMGVYDMQDVLGLRG